VTKNLLLLFHCDTNAGYAIGSLERVFDETAREICGSDGVVHYAYNSLSGGLPSHLGPHSTDVAEMRYGGSSPVEEAAYVRWLEQRRIELVLGFDLPVHAPILSVLRRAGVRRVVSYCGASISSLYPLLLLPIRRLQYLTSIDRPDHFVFESEGMRRRATHGAAIPADKTSLCRLGVDCVKYRPDHADSAYPFDVFGIPKNRKIVIFTGHMEPRKGVHVLIQAFRSMFDELGRRDVHLLLLGNRDDDEQRLRSFLGGSSAGEYVTFGGYRSDVDRIHRGVSLGVIASTGWDSFTMSSIEMAASGLPLIVSDLPGLIEAVVPGHTGEVVVAGDIRALRDAMDSLLQDPVRLKRLGAQARTRAVAQFSREVQKEELTKILRKQFSLG
jgi:glycosyltransferase involved in cell wall biosynthesis